MRIHCVCAVNVYLSGTVDAAMPVASTVLGTLMRATTWCVVVLTCYYFSFRFHGLFCVGLPVLPV